MTAQAQWSTSSSVNTPIATAASTQMGAKVVSDGNGGHFIGWVDARSGTQNIYLQHINSAGVAQWATNGIKVVSVDKDQSELVMVSDSAGGVILAWTETRDGVTGKDIYMQRFNSAGDALWTVDGIVLTGAGTQESIAICSDGNNGVFVCFDQPDSFPDSHQFAQWVDATGTIKWGTGVALSISSTSQVGGKVIADGSGGAIYTWSQYRILSTECDIYAQRINTLGSREWTDNGVRVSLLRGENISPGIINDGSTGAFIFWEKRFQSGSYYGQHLNSSGTSLWLGLEPKLLSNARDAIMTADGGTGFHLAWGNISNNEVRAQRYDSAGAEQWTAGGVLLGASLPFRPAGLRAVSDGAGGGMLDG